MSQAEIAGGTVSLANELPSKGHRIADFGLMTKEQQLIHPSDYRGKRSLVLVFADERKETAELLAALCNQYAKIREEEGEVLAIVWAEHGAGLKEELKVTYPVLFAPDSSIHHEFGGVDQHGQPAAAVYVTDRYGEVFGVFRRRDGQPLPSVAEILSLLEFISIQCPECAPPEWPV
jgi:peroxiredoxin